MQPPASHWTHSSLPKNGSLLGLWYEALAEEIGIVISTNNPDLLRQKLYAERRASGDPDLDSLVVRPSKFHPESELWIMRKKNEKE